MMIYMFPLGFTLILFGFYRSQTKKVDSQMIDIFELLGGGLLICSFILLISFPEIFDIR